MRRSVYFGLSKWLAWVPEQWLDDILRQRLRVGNLAYV